MCIRDSHQHGAAEGEAELQTHGGDDRDHGIAQGVVDDDPGLAQALGPGLSLIHIFSSHCGPKTLGVLFLRKE